MLVTAVMRRRDFVSHVALLLMRLGIRAEGARQAVSADDRGVASGPGGSPGCGRGVTPPAPCPTGTRFHLPFRGPTPTRVPVGAMWLRPDAAPQATDSHLQTQF